MLTAGYAQEVSSRRKDRRKAQLQPGSKEIVGVNGLAWFESRSKREHAQRRPKLLTEVGVPATERRCTTAAITTMVPLRLCGGKLLVAVTRERRYGPSRLRVNDDDDDGLFGFEAVLAGRRFDR